MCTIRKEWWRRVLNERENRRMTGTGGYQTGAEKIFIGGRGCENLQRDVPGRGGETDEDQIK